MRAYHEEEVPIDEIQCSSIGCHIGGVYNFNVGNETALLEDVNLFSHTMMKLSSVVKDFRLAGLVFLGFAEGLVLKDHLSQSFPDINGRPLQIEDMPLPLKIMVTDI